VECIQAGLYFGYLGDDRESVTMHDHGDEAGGLGSITVLATGGLSALFARRCRKARRVPDLTLEGLRIAYRRLAGGGVHETTLGFVHGPAACGTARARYLPVAAERPQRPASATVREPAPTAGIRRLARAVPHASRTMDKARVVQCTPPPLVFDRRCAALQRQIGHGGLSRHLRAEQALRPPVARTVIGPEPPAFISMIVHL